MNDCKACAKRLKAQRKGIKRYRAGVAAAAALRVRGFGVTEIATELGVSQAEVLNLLKPSSGGTKRGGRPRIVDIEAVKAMLLEGLSAREIAEQLGCHVNSVYRAWKALLAD